MQEKQDYAADPSQSSESGQEDSSSTFRLSSKLRNKLEKLAQWRIDPSLIEFSEDAREFRGGFATVSQGLLASPPPPKGGANESERITDEHQNSEEDNPQSPGNTQRPEEDHQDKNQGAYSRAAGDEHDVGHTKGEERNENDEEQKPDNQSSILEIGCGLGPSDHTGGEEPDPGNCDTQSQSDIHKPEDDQQGKDEETESRIANGDHGQTKEAAIKDPENTKDEQNRDRQASEPKQIIAVKRLKIEEDTDLERVLGLALRESEFLADVSHSNIVKFEGFVEDLSAHKVWLIFPWEEHGNLRDFLASGEWDIPERISLINDVTLGLEYLHSREPPIYHGDLKSLNILVNSEFRALITDFGSARHLGDEPGRLRKQTKGDGGQPHSTPSDATVDEHITLHALFSATASTITLTGSSYTLRWAAPELLQEDGPCLRSDIWALGWIAYEVMTNTIPFHDIKKDAIVINRVIQGQLPSVTEHARMSLVRALCSLMVQCWSLNPDKRPAAEECRKSISWMPMLAPAPKRSVDEEASQIRRARLLNELGVMYRNQGDYLNALSCSTEALSIYTAKNDIWGRGETLRYLADIHRFRVEFTEAITFYSEALQIYTDPDEDRAIIVYGLADTHRSRHEYGEAIELYSEALQLFTNNKQGRAMCLNGLATVHKLQDEYSEAINLHSEALRIFTDVGDLRARAISSSGLAEAYQAQHEYEEAINLYSEALKIFTDIGDRHWGCEALLGLARTHQIQDHHNEAISFYTRASEGFAEIGLSSDASDALENAADIRRILESAPEDHNGTVEVQTET